MDFRRVHFKLAPRAYARKTWGISWLLTGASLEMPLKHHCELLIRRSSMMKRCSSVCRFLPFARAKGRAKSLPERRSVGQARR